MSDGSTAFEALRQALHDISQVDSNTQSTTTIRLDLNRAQRCGVPEIVHAERKSAKEVQSSLLRLADANGRAVASRCPAAILQELSRTVRAPFTVIVHDAARVAIVTKDGAEPEPTGGRVGVISAGSSDAPIAAEAALMAREMGCAVSEVRDVGVAGLHRLVRPLAQLLDEGVDVIVVAAGMDGALPSVVAGLVAVPVIGLPVSVGYGYGGNGEAALMSMLQSCAPGLTVVNIDNGIGAGATAALIANRVAQAERRTEV